MMFDYRTTYDSTNCNILYGQRDGAVKFENGPSFYMPDVSQLIGPTGVNAKPTAVAITTGAVAGSPLDLPVASVLSRNSDPEADPLHVASVSNSTNGVTVNLIGSDTNGTIRYPVPADYTGFDQFNYTIADNRGGTNTGSVLVSVVPASPPPGTMLSLRWTSNQAALTFTGVPWLSYELQRAPTPLGTWQSFTNAVASPNGATSVLDESPFPGAGFYRAGTTNP